jgi:hypothetical protein
MSEKKHVYDMSADEVLNLIKTEFADYTEHLSKSEDLGEGYFQSVEWDDNRLFDLYLGYKVFLDSEKLREQLPQFTKVLFAEVEVEFNRRLGLGPAAG